MLESAGVKLGENLRPRSARAIGFKSCVSLAPRHEPRPDSGSKHHISLALILLAANRQWLWPTGTNTQPSQSLPAKADTIYNASHMRSLSTNGCMRNRESICKHEDEYKYVSTQYKSYTGLSALTSQSPDPVEDYPQGYPRFSALVGASDQFHICRRFSNLRSRLLLVKQDKLSLLESQLENVDREEESVLFLGSNRVDKNDERLSLLSQIEDALTDYGASIHLPEYPTRLTFAPDALVERNFRTFRYEPAKPRDILSLQNWINGNSCIARAESAYLDKEKDLVGVSPSLDGAATGLEVWIEDWLVRFHKLFRKVGKAKALEQHYGP